uniref:Uncharacterized protein n=1 Tax=viral metagenome TaxID=1070528 RepID=A0A6C0BNZ0_9ZZZZ
MSLDIVCLQCPTELNLILTISDDPGVWENPSSPTRC